MVFVPRRTGAGGVEQLAGRESLVHFVVTHSHKIKQGMQIKLTVSLFNRMRHHQGNTLGETAREAHSPRFPGPWLGYGMGARDREGRTVGATRGEVAARTAGGAGREYTTCA